MKIVLKSELTIRINLFSKSGHIKIYFCLCLEKVSKILLTFSAAVNRENKSKYSRLLTVYHTELNGTVLTDFSKERTTNIVVWLNTEKHLQASRHPYSVNCIQQVFQ